MKCELIQQINNYLDTYETAPSACCFIHLAFYGDCTKEDKAGFHKAASEETNRHYCDELIKRMSDEQLMCTAAMCLETLLDQLACLEG